MTEDVFIIPTSFAQQRLWLLEQLEPGTAAFNMSAAVRLTGSLDVPALRRSLNEVVRRHESLRTTFAGEDGEPVQVIAEELELALPVIELAGGGDGEDEVRHLARDEAQKPFDLAEGPLLRATLLRAAHDRHVLLLTMHHIVSDGWSLAVFIRELTTLYRAFVAGDPSPLKEPSLQYADFALWQREWLRGEVLENAVGYWREQLAGAPRALELPTDRPRPAVQTFRGSRHCETLSRPLGEALWRLSRGAGVTLFMTLLAAFKLLLYRHTRQADVVVGTPVAGRTRAEVEGLIGFFVNTLVLRTDLSDDPSFRELLGRVREACLGAFAHQELPFEKLLEELRPERDLSRTPLFQVYFNMLNFPDADIELPGLSVSFLTPPEVESKFDLTLYVKEEREGLRFELVYNADLFAPERMAEMIGQLTHLLAQAAENPDARLNEFSLVTPEARKVLPDPAASLDASWRGAVHTIFSAQARRAPENLAAADKHEVWNYRDLDARSNQLANYLRAQGIELGDAVAIYGHRSATLVWALLGVMKAGAAFVIVDPAYPPARLIACLDLARPKGWLQVGAAGPLPAPLEEYLDASPMHCRLVLPRRAEAEAEGLLAEFSDEDPEVRLGPDDLAYVAFTSGSTGVPKGVLGRHGPLTHFTPWLERTFGLGEADRFTMLSGIAHDPLHRDIFTPLQLGASVHIPDPEEMAAPGRMAGWMEQERVTVAHLTPAMGQLLTEAAPGGEARRVASLRYVFLVGDVLTRRDVKRLRRLAPSVTCVNYYGSTETQRAVSFFVVPDDGHADAAEGVKEILPLGRGIDDVQLLVLNESHERAGVGEVGEIYLRSPHLAGGYLGDEELTRERFLVNPWTREEGDRIYRTGDLGRYLPDGGVEPLGRADLQVKIRGFRVELGEIEAALGKHQAVGEAVVVAREFGTGDRRLVGYIVPDGGRPGVGSQPRRLESELRLYLKDLLPGYMIPSTFVVLDALPLTPNGKVNRRALPAPAETPAPAAHDFTAPRTPVEDVLTGIWAEVLGTARVGVNDNFFELGGHSLLATQVMARVRHAFGVELPLRGLFESPTVAGIAARVDAALVGGEQSPTAILPADRSQEPPLSFAQQRLWFLDQLEPGNAFYNVGAAVHLAGALDEAALRRSLREIIARHDVLRTTFAEVNGRPSQRVAAELELPLAFEDLSARAAAEGEQEARRLAGEELRRPFDLARGPLIRLKLVRLAADAHVVVVVMHHIISDGWSSGIFVREMAALYEAFSSGREAALATLPLQYADFAAWQREWLRGEPLERELAYWHERLGGAETVLELPADRPRPSVFTHRGAKHYFALGGELSRVLREFARRESSTLYMVLLAAYQTLLFRHTGQEDVSVGSPVAGRNRLEVEGLIGFFANTLVLRTDLSGDPSFRELLGRVRETALGAYAHQNVPFEMLVERLQPARSLSHTPLFQVALTLQNAPAAALDIRGLTLRPLEVETGTAKFDLLLTLEDAGEGLSGFFEYSTDLFDAETVARMEAHLRTLLEGAVADPDETIARLPLLGAAEREQLRAASAGARAVFPPRGCLHELFERQAALTPDAVAVTHEQEHVTYGALNARANRLARRLAESGVRPDVVVGVLLERSAEMVVGLLAVLKAGGAYLPLTPSGPKERLAFMLEDARCEVLLTERGSAGALPEHGGRVVFTDEGAGDGENLGVQTNVENLAYVIYTSGSTGRPKGVSVTHANVTRLFDSTARRFAFDGQDVWTLFHSYAFDFSVWEMWGALLYGGRLVIVPYWVSRSPESFYELACSEGVTVLNQTPSAFRHFIRAAQGAPGLKSNLRAVIFGGEALELQSLRPWVELDGTARPELVNMYGITETTVHVTYQRLTAEHIGGAAGSLIGRPIDDLEVYVLDAHLQPVPFGVRGEIYVGGAGLARGYLHRPELTAERFVPHPYAAGARLYKTGDLARFRADGSLEYLGRIDHQVKVRGFRIELGDIESALASHPAVGAALVMAVGEDPGAKRLVAYLATGGAPAPPVGELHAHLKERLPEYMIPHAFVALETLPLTSNGKVDRKALLALDRAPAETAKVSAPVRTDIERVLAGVWEEVLGVEGVGTEDNFFELGGDSILSIQIVSKARQAGVHVTPKQLFQQQTIAGLAAVATSVGRQTDGRPASGPVALTPIQHWFFEQKLPTPHHYNQSVLLETRESLDPALLDEAFRHLLAHHDALRLRFRRGPAGWQQFEPLDEDGGDAPPVTHVDLSAVTAAERDAAFERATADAQASLDLERGPLVRVVLFDLSPHEATRLLIVIHHLVVDGVSWRVLLEDLQAAYKQLSRGEAVALPARTTSFRQWAERSQEYARSAELAREAQFWLAAPREGACRLPARRDAAAGTFATARTLTTALDAAETRALLQDVPAAHYTQVNDALLAALAAAFRRWCGPGALHLDLEGHGREEIFDDLDVSRTVGWFTTQFPVWLEVGAAAGPVEVLRAVKEQLRAVPQRGLGYGLLRYLSGDDSIAGGLRRQPQAEVRFNYLGQFDQLRDAASGFAEAREGGGPSGGADAPLSHLLDINCRVINGRLEISWRYDANAFAGEAVEELAEGYTRELRELVRHCRDASPPAHTPSDFPLAGLEQEALDGLVAAHAPVEDLYPLSPLQQGLLFHTLQAPDTDMYFLHLSCRFEGSLDADAFRRAWQAVVARHAILRTAFVWRGLTEPLQVVRARVELPWEEADWRGLAADEQQARLATYLRKNRARGFDLDRAPLTRLALFRLADDVHHFVWSSHHIVLDGWSYPILIREVLAFYDAYSRGREQRLPPPRPFRDYIAWLGRQDSSAARDYWQKTLRGFTTPTPVGVVKPARADAAPRDTYAIQKLRVPLAETRALQAFGRAHQLTLNTLVKGAWALLLGGGEEADIVFGTVVSGRPAELDGAGTMVGLLINTLPVRVPAEGGGLIGWLRGIQEQQLEMQQYEHSPLVDVQQWSDVPRSRPMFESIMSFLNYPVHDAVAEWGGPLRVRDIEFLERVNYALALVASARAELELELKYDRRRFDDATVARALELLRKLLGEFAARPRQGLEAFRGLVREDGRRRQEARQEGYREARRRTFESVKRKSQPTRQTGGEGGR